MQFEKRKCPKALLYVQKNTFNTTDAANNPVSFSAERFG